MSFTYSFERLDVWKNSISLSKEIYKSTTSFPKDELYGLVSQMRRSSVSIASNIAEGSGKTSFKEQARFTQIAFASALELLNQLIISNELEYIDNLNLTKLRKQIEKITQQLNYLRKSQLSRVKEDEVAYTYAKDSTLSPSPHHPITPSTNYFSHETAHIDPGATIGTGTKIWHFSHIMSAAQLGEQCNIGQNVFIADGVVLGNNVKVQNNVSIYNGVVCEDNVFLGPSMVFTNVVNPRSAVNRKGEYAKTLVQKGVTIGANATIVCGNIIGQYAFIGAGTVVTKDIPAYALVVGNPAKQIGWMSAHGCRLEFDEEGKAVCGESGEEYHLKDYEVIRLSS